MSKYRRQHYIPQVLLRNVSSDGVHLCQYDSKTEKLIENRTIGTIAFVPHLYTIEYDQERDFALEKHFGKIENDAKAMLERVAQFGVSVNLTQANSDDIRFLIEFIAILISRTPKRAKLAQTHGADPNVLVKIKANAKSKGIADNEVEDYLCHVRETKGFTFAFVFAAITEDMLNKLTYNFDIILHKSYSGSLILNDNYAIFELARGVNPDSLIGQDWWTQQIRIHCPLSSKDWLTFTPKKRPDENFEFSVVLTDKNHIEELNWRSFNQKEQYVYCVSADEIKKYLI